MSPTSNPWALRGAVAFAILLLVPPAEADACREDGQNRQCNSLGSIAMDAQRDVHGSPITLEVRIRLDRSFADQGARWVLFSVRNSTADSPVWVQVDGLRTQAGELTTTRVERVSAAQTDVWVDVLDLPVGQTITMNLTVGATQRGAYRIETLVMPFDRGYASLPDRDQRDVSLFSFTLLGVNGETDGAAGGGGGLLSGHKLPGPSAAAGVAAALLAAAAFGRRRSA